MSTLQILEIVDQLILLGDRFAVHEGQPCTCGGGTRINVISDVDKIKNIYQFLSKIIEVEGTGKSIKIVKRNC